jgi:hypothetical protein
MPEQFKKIVKIALIAGAGMLLLLIVLAIKGFIVGSTTNMMSVGDSSGYNKANLDYSPDIGLGLAFEESAMAPQAASRQKSALGNTVGSGGESIFNEGDLTNKKIIKNGYLTVYVNNADTAAQKISELAVGLGGFVSELNISESSDGIKRGNITIRIPATEFETALHNVKTLAAEVENENVSAQDVTEQYVDLSAQLKNLAAEEARYLEIMAKSYNVNDTLQVASRLSDVRSRIERIQGQLQYLSRQVDMSTIRVNLSADADIKVFGLKWRPLIVAKRALKSLFADLTDYTDKMIAFLIHLPVILLWLITITIGIIITWRVLYWIYRRWLRRAIGLKTPHDSQQP